MGDPADAEVALGTMIGNGYLPDSSLYSSVMESLFADDDYAGEWAERAH